MHLGLKLIELSPGTGLLPLGRDGREVEFHSMFQPSLGRMPRAVFQSARQTKKHQR